MKKLAYKEEIAKAKNYLEGLKTKYYDEIKLRPGITQDQQKATDFFNRYNEEQKAKLKQLIMEGTNVKQEVQDLSEGLRETVKAVADEMQIKPQILNKAINVAFKSNMDEVQEQMDELESILVSTGHLKEV